MMRRIAYASPVNPVASGISDYSEELLPFLGQYADLTLYLDDGLRPDNPQLERHLALRPLSRLEQDHRRHPYDAVVYHMGNSPAHVAIWQAMQRVRGVLVLHDFVLHHFMLTYAATVRGDVTAYLAEASRRYGPTGARVAELMVRGRLTPEAFDLPFCEAVVTAADGLIAHSRYVCDRVAQLQPDLAMALVPMGVPLPPAIERDTARARLGLPRDALILASFGHINPYKRLEAVLRALRVLRAERPDLRYLLVGSVSPHYDVRAMVSRAGLDSVVAVTGYVERHAFEDYVAAADICLNLRHPTAGETSASLLRLLGAGRPTLVTASGSFAELPEGVAAQVDPDDSEGDLILAYCRLLASRPDFAAALGAAARSYVARQHTLDQAAAGYIRFLAARYGWGNVPRAREPLWDVRPVDAGTPVQMAGSIAPIQSNPAFDPQRRGFDLQPVAEALAGIGATEEDQALLRAVAAGIAVIGGG